MRQRTPPSELILFWSYVNSVFTGSLSLSRSLSRSVGRVGDNPGKEVAKTPCIEESETAVLVFLLMEYWSPKQGRVGYGRQNLYRITVFDSK